MSLIETDLPDLKILDKISVNLYAGKSLKSSNWKAGIGIERELININDLFSIGMGGYVTKGVKEMFNPKAPINYSVGLSLTGKF